MKNSKAQIAIEFMIIFGIFLMAVILTLFFVWDNVYEMNTASLEAEARAVADMIGGKLDTVFLEGDGFYTNVTVPEFINGLNYTLEAGNGGVWVTVENRSYGRVVLPPEITGTMDKGVNTLRNSNGVIVVS